ncbi:leucine-rich repeat domain, L domain-like protein [Artemisia annua]|uniref:Leucine-rich repeat domain, L domain-like protein n=1 Tax=Artemisia annua TaxID=35608 RepID=A0A2U1PUH5_ARTAN|nr:leucine-rich repeat domain, L domain-like protein [Artemisia annua]
MMNKIPWSFADYDMRVMQVIKGVALEYSKNWKFVINMDLSSNKLVGKISLELMTLYELMGLNLSHNHLSRTIPQTIGKMKSLVSLDLSGNELMGAIPPSMAALNFLRHLNLSHNSLSGRIPVENQLQTLTDPSIYAGNRDLCGAPLPKNCSYQEDSTTTTTNEKYEDANEPNMVWFYLAIFYGLATGFWGVIGVLIFKKQWRHKLYMFTETTMDEIYVSVTVRVSKMKRGREAA